MKINDLKNLRSLSIPYAELKLEEDAEGNLKVFDPIRKKLLMLTPEEFVRQNFVRWISEAYGYPNSLIANEVEIQFNGMKRRCDSVIYDRQCNPLIIVEYKAPDVAITQSTFDQIVRYNMELRAKYLIISNGVNHYCCKIDYIRNTYNFIPVIPRFEEAIGTPGIN